jgi:VWFA-related protein
MTYNRDRIAAWLLVLCLAVNLYGQDRDQEVVRITTNLVQLDLVVTKDGKQIKDLKPADFEILEDGRRQTITHFAYVSTNPAPPNTEAPKTGIAAPLIPKPPLPQEIKRTIAIVVDDLGISFQSMANLRTYLPKFLNENLRPNDLIAIIRTGGEVGALQQFTADARVLSSAIADLKWNPCSRVGTSVIAPERSLVAITPPEPALHGRTDRLTSSGQVDRPTLAKESNPCAVGNSVSYTVAALRFILKGMRELPGRKSMMVISDNLPQYDQEMAPADFGFKRPVREDETLVDVWTQSTSYTDKLNSLAELAIRGSVVIYGVSSQRLQTTGPQPADEISFPPFTQIKPRGSDQEETLTKLMRTRSLELLRNTDAGELLAKETGGFFVRNNNDFGLDRIFEDQNGYYVIGYRPESTTFDRRFHTIQARVKRGGFAVRTRSGFYGVEQKEESVQPSARDHLNHALVSPFGKNEIAVRVATLFANDPARGSLLRVFLNLDAKDLSFTAEPDGTKVAKLDLSSVLFGENGAIADRLDQNATLRLRGKPFERAMQEGVVYGFDLPVKQSGGLQLRVALRDVKSERIGASGQFIHVPNLSNGELALSSLILQGDGGEDQKSNIVLKRFHQGTSLAFAYTIYNASVDKTTRLPKLKTTTLVLQDGVKIYNSQQAVEATNQTDLQRIATGSRLQLGTVVTPGQYALQIVVEDQISKRTATQWTQFEVIK